MEFRKASSITDGFEETLIAGYKRFYSDYEKDVKTPEYDHTIEIPKDIAFDQSNGIDRRVYLNDGCVIKHEEKIRKDVYDDIALEFISNSKTMEKGWADRKLLCDCITYAFVPNKMIYYIEYTSFYSVVKLYKGRLIEGFGLTPTNPDKNPGYYAFCCYVPVFILRELGVKIGELCMMTKEEKRKQELLKTPEGRNIYLKEFINLKKKRNG